MVICWLNDYPKGLVYSNLIIMLEDKVSESAIEKDLIDQYQSTLHIDDKTKLDALSLYNQYDSKYNISSVSSL